MTWPVQSSDSHHAVPIHQFLSLSSASPKLYLYFNRVSHNQCMWHLKRGSDARDQMYQTMFWQKEVTHLAVLDTPTGPVPPAALRRLCQTLCEHLHTNKIGSGMKLYFMTDTHSLREQKVHVCSNNVLIKMAKWMSPYWDNKSLPTPYLTLPNSLSSTFRLFPSLLLKIHAFPTWYLVRKGRGEKFSKTWIRTKVDRVKKDFQHVLYHLRHWSCF